MQNNKKIVHALIFAVGVLCSIIALLVLSTKNTSAERAMYSGNERHVVNVDDAAQWTANFRKDAPSSPLLAGYMGKNIFEKILKQDNCVGIRIYNAKHENGNPVLVLVGVDEKGNDITAGTVGEDIIPCPPYCSGGGGPVSLLQLPVSGKPLAIAQ